MLRWAAIASSRAAMRLAVASSRPLIVHPPMAPVGARANTIVRTRPLLLSSIARLPSDFSATRGYARGRNKPISSEEEEDEDEDLVDDDDEDDDDDEELDGEEDFDDEDDSDDGENGRSDRY